MTTPAQRFVAAQTRNRHPELARFAGLYPFGLDDFQVQACEALEDGDGVLVAAPTGSGKTVVGEFAIHLALATGQKCFYTTPIKALSNQKFGDLVERYGPESVGLLTGDNSVNGEAPVVVMTTEVLRNMLYAGSSTLSGLAYVVMDEVHYLADRSRGAVWEEVIIHLPESVTVVALSATVSNAEEFGEWLGEVRGGTTIVVSEHRPVPLWQQVQVGQRLHDLFVDDAQREVNPELLRLARDEERMFRMRGHRPRRGERRGRPPGVPTRAEVVEALERRDLLPAIVFIFSRAGCDAAVRQLLASGVRLADPDDRPLIREIALARTDSLGEDDLRVLGHAEWLEGLERGFASHHAGLLPAFKEVVEQLFAEGLIKVVFATETLALGINMPARTVVLEKLSKWNGETHADVTPAEYTQLTGRAGRRGIDVEGDAVVLWQPGFDPRALAGLAATRTYPLRSSFRPTYNMAVNLVGQLGRVTARDVLESSFAQFQADRAVVGLARQVRRNETTLTEYRDSMTCHLGDFAEYAALRERISQREKELARARSAAGRAAAQDSLNALRPGDVVELPGGRRSGLAVVVSTERPGSRSSSDDDVNRVVVMTQRGQVRRLSPGEISSALVPIGHLRLSKSFNARNPSMRRDLGRQLHDIPLPDRRSGKRPRSGAPAGDDTELLELRAAMRAHPCHGCAEREDHARWAERYYRLQRETDELQRRVEQRTNTIARTFDRVLAVLEELGYVAGDDVLPAGRHLAQIYGELDLVAAECLRHGTWSGLAPAELAAAVSLLVFEARRDDAASPKLPGGRARDAIDATFDLAEDVRRLEREHRLSVTRVPDAGFAWAAFRWASGHRLESVLHESDLTAGDFVRWVRQLVDLLGQLASATEDPALRDNARTAIQGLQRGVVSAVTLD